MQPILLSALCAIAFVHTLAPGKSLLPVGIWRHAGSEAAVRTEGGVINSCGLNDVRSMIAQMWAVPPLAPGRSLQPVGL